MMVHLASVGLSLAVLILGTLALLIDNDTDEEIMVKWICGVLALLAAVHLGIRIGEGVF